MKASRPLLFVISSAASLFLLGGGVVGRVGAEETSYREVVRFSEILSLVVDNYVDPVESDELMSSAYEGLLAALDANGAYLDPDEVAEWKAGGGTAGAHPGVAVLKAGHSLQVVFVASGSAAEEAGIRVGDQIRSVDGRTVRDLSLFQSIRLLRGRPGSELTLETVRPVDGFSRRSVTLSRDPGPVEPYRLERHGDVSVLVVRDPGAVDPARLGRDLRQASADGATGLLVDLRNTADLAPRDVRPLAAALLPGAHLRLKDRAEQVLDSIELAGGEPAWSGPAAVLVNGATAGSAEAFAALADEARGWPVLGEETYGLGAEARLFELDTGAGLIISSALWETSKGRRWNEDGVEPAEEINGQGRDYESLAGDQLERALEWFREHRAALTPAKRAA